MGAFCRASVLPPCLQDPTPKHICLAFLYKHVTNYVPYRQKTRPNRSTADDNQATKDKLCDRLLAAIFVRWHVRWRPVTVTATGLHHTPVHFRNSADWTQVKRDDFWIFNCAQFSTDHLIEHCMAI